MIRISYRLILIVFRILMFLMDVCYKFCREDQTCIMADSWPNRKSQFAHRRIGTFRFVWSTYYTIKWWNSVNIVRVFNICGEVIQVQTRISTRYHHMYMHTWHAGVGRWPNCISESRHAHWVWSGKLYYALCFYGKWWTAANWKLGY